MDCPLQQDTADRIVSVDSGWLFSVCQILVKLINCLRQLIGLTAYGLNKIHCLQ